jgi:hypothetical protein
VGAHDAGQPRTLGADTPEAVIGSYAVNHFIQLVFPLNGVPSVACRSNPVVFSVQQEGRRRILRPGIVKREIRVMAFQESRGLLGRDRG